MDEKIVRCMKAVTAAMQGGRNEQDELHGRIHKLMKLTRRSLENGDLSVKDFGVRLGVACHFTMVGNFLLHARHYDIDYMDGFAPLYEEVREFVADVVIPLVERMQKEKEEEGIYVDWMESDWMDYMKNMIQDEQNGPGSERQAQHYAMMAEERAVRLEGNRARLALEHAMFVEWLQNQDKGHIYEEFRKYLTTQYEQGKHYGTGADIKEADTFMERRDWWDDS